MWMSCGGRLGAGGSWAGAGQEETHNRSGALALPAAEVDVASALLNQALGDPESDAGADFRLGGEEWRKHATLHFRGHANPVVGERDANACLQAVRPVPGFLCAEPDPAAMVACIDGIGHQVEQRLAELAIFAVDRKVRFD